MPADLQASFRASLLRLVDTVLAMLRFYLRLLRVLGHERFIVLARRGRPPGTVPFVLVLLAACRRYGHRSEPDDHAPLLIRRQLVSVGSYASA